MNTTHSYALTHVNKKFDFYPLFYILTQRHRKDFFVAVDQSNFSQKETKSGELRVFLVTRNILQGVYLLLVDLSTWWGHSCPQSLLSLLAGGAWGTGNKWIWGHKIWLARLLTKAILNLANQFNCFKSLTTTGF